MSPREGLREMVQCHRRQHFAASNDLHEHPRGHSSWKEPPRMKFRNIQMEYSKMRSEPSEHVWKTRVILIHLESYFGKYAQEVWERKSNGSWYAWCIVHETSESHVVAYVQSNTDGDDSEEISWTIWKVRSDDNSWGDHRFSARNFAWLGIDLERARRILGMTFRKIYTEDLVLIASLDLCKWDWPCWENHRGDRLRNRKRLTEYIWKVFMRLFQCKKQSTHTNVSHRLNLRVLHRRVAQTSFRDESVDSTSKVLGSIMMSVSLSFEVKDYDISRAYFQGTQEKLIYIWPERVLNTTPNFEWRMWRCVEANTTQHCSAIQTKIWEWQRKVIWVFVGQWWI